MSPSLLVPCARRSPDRSRSVGVTGYPSAVSRTQLDVNEFEPGVLVITGEIDAHSAPLLEERLGSVAPGPVALDMSGVVFMDSSGLRVLVGEQQRRSAAGGQLTIVDPSAGVQRLLAIVGLGSLFSAEPEPPES